jgi:hypothetical protein
VTDQKQVHWYRVVEVFDPTVMPEVKPGTILRDRWRGKSTTYEIERQGKSTAWCRAEHIGRAN